MLNKSVGNIITYNEIVNMNPNSTYLVRKDAALPNLRYFHEPLVRS
jgi:hypothetical protein